MLNHMSAKPMWKAVIDPRSQDDVERLMIEHGSFTRADEVFEALDRGETPEGAEVVDLAELRRRYG